MSVFVLYLTFSLLMPHLSLMFLDGHFETTPDYDFTDNPIHTFLPYFPVLKAQDMRHCAPASRSLATWPKTHYDSAESIATPLESDFDDEQLRALLASPLFLQERGASAERSQVYHSERENLMSSSSEDQISTGKPVALFSSHHRLKKERAASLSKAHSKILKQEFRDEKAGTGIRELEGQLQSNRMELATLTRTHRGTSTTS